MLLMARRSAFKEVAGDVSFKEGKDGTRKSLLGWKPRAIRLLMICARPSFVVVSVTVISIERTSSRPHVLSLTAPGPTSRRQVLDEQRDLAR
jgi:hypothetical protein